MLSSFRSAAMLTLLATAPLCAQTIRLRNQVEADRVSLAAAWRAAPADPAARRAYATVLFQLGEVWEARDVIAPAAGPADASPADLHLAARLAYLTGDYPGAESLYQRLRTAADGDSLRTEAGRGLALSYYQQNRFDRTGGLALAGLDEVGWGAFSSSCRNSRVRHTASSGNRPSGWHICRC